MRIKERTEFGERLVAARRLAKLSQHGLAERSGLQQSTIAGLEVNGRGSSKVASLARACGVRVLWLERGEGPMLGPESTSEAAHHVAEEALVSYPVPSDNRDYRTVIHTLADALEQSGLSTLTIKQFVALADATYEKLSAK